MFWAQDGMIGKTWRKREIIRPEAMSEAKFSLLEVLCGDVAKIRGGGAN